MTPMIPVVIMSINYSHDIATALLAVSGAVLWMLSSLFPSEDSSGLERYFVAAYHGITRLAKLSLFWILAAGVPRIVFYTQYEWSDAAGDLQVIAIIIKHVVMFLLVGTGLFYWHKLAKRVQQLHLKHG